jgi:hypothetical protein
MLVFNNFHIVEFLENLQKTNKKEGVGAQLGAIIILK